MKNEYTVYFSRPRAKTGKPIVIRDKQGNEVYTTKIVLVGVDGTLEFNNAPEVLRRTGNNTVFKVPGIMKKMEDGTFAIFGEGIP